MEENRKDTILEVSKTNNMEKTTISRETKTKLTKEIKEIEKVLKEIKECAESQKTNGGHFWYMGKIRSKYLITQIEHELNMKKKLREEWNK